MEQELTLRDLCRVSSEEQYPEGFAEMMDDKLADEIHDMLDEGMFDYPTICPCCGEEVEKYGEHLKACHQEDF